MCRFTICFTIGVALMGGLLGICGSLNAQPSAMGRYQTMDYGPVIADTVQLDWPDGGLEPDEPAEEPRRVQGGLTGLYVPQPGRNMVRKGLAIRLDHDATMVFDTDLLRFAAGSVGGWLNLARTERTGYRDARVPILEGRHIFGSSAFAGWSRDGSFEAERQSGHGNLPHDWAHYKGFHRSGDRILLEYTVGDTEVWETPETVKEGEMLAFVRNIRTGPSDGPMSAYILEQREGWSVARSSEMGVIFETDEGALAVVLFGRPGEAQLASGESGGVALHLNPSPDVRHFRLAIFELESVDDSRLLEFSRFLRGHDLPDFDAMLGGGPRRWNDDIVVQGQLGEQSGGYAVDRIPLPEENPWGSWMRPAGFDFFECGTRAALSTWNGDVWIVSGLDDFESVTWTRFASGLFFPMGLVIVDEEIYVIERSQLTRLRDINGNGEADFYENFNNDGVLHPRAHSLTLDVDSEGNFYFFKNGNRTPEFVPDHGALIRVSADGSTREVFANGIRGANTLGIAPDDRIFSADQQGHMVPTERIDWLREGRFYGYRPHGGEDVPFGEFELPVCWVPYGINNSSGAIHFAHDERWGPMHGNWILGSYGRQRLFAVLTEEIGDQIQGGVVQFPLEFTSGLMRARVNPRDGQFYVAGLRGWQTLAREDGSFDRVRYTGDPVYLPTAFNVTPEGVRLTFSEPLVRVAAENIANYEVERWEYIYGYRYGSPEMSLRDPGREGRDPVEVASASLSDDGKTVFLEIPDIMPVMQQKVGFNLLFADGHEEENAVYHTIHVLSEDDVPIRQMVAQVDLPDEAVDESENGVDHPEWYLTGRESFELNCIVCHQQGGVAPAMEDSEWAAGSPEALIRILLHGKVGERGVMTPFGWMEDDEIAAILSYIRVRWHDEDMIDAGDIGAVREETSQRRNLWTEEELRELIQ